MKMKNITFNLLNFKNCEDLKRITALNAQFEASAVDYQILKYFLQNKQIRLILNEQLADNDLSILLNRVKSIIPADFPFRSLKTLVGLSQTHLISFTQQQDYKTKKVGLVSVFVKPFVLLTHPDFTYYLAKFAICSSNSAEKKKFMEMISAKSDAEWKHQLGQMLHSHFQLCFGDVKCEKAIGATEPDCEQMLLIMQSINPQLARHEVYSTMMSQSQPFVININLLDQISLLQINNSYRLFKCQHYNVFNDKNKMCPICKVKSKGLYEDIVIKSLTKALLANCGPVQSIEIDLNTMSVLSVKKMAEESEEQWFQQTKAINKVNQFSTNRKMRVLQFTSMNKQISINLQKIWGNNLLPPAVSDPLSAKTIDRRNELSRQLSIRKISPFLLDFENCLKDSNCKVEFKAKVMRSSSQITKTNFAKQFEDKKIVKWYDNIQLNQSLPPLVRNIINDEKKEDMKSSLLRRQLKLKINKK